MDKVVLLTNFNSWYMGMPSKIKKRVNWNEDSYPDEENPITKCATDKDDRIILQSVSNLSAEGVYLVFDQIDKSRLATLLDNCKRNNDRLFILLHSRGFYTQPVDFEKWKEICTFAKGMHEPGIKYRYEPVFDILTDNLGDALNRIINSIFMPLGNAINTFLDECVEPKKKLENLLSYHILCEEGFKDAVEAFRNKYESCQSCSEYAKEWDWLNDLLKGVSEK